MTDTIVQWNSRSLRKRPEFLQFLREQRPCIVAIQETLLNDNLPLGFEWPEGYTLISNPTRYGSRGRPLGGSILLVRSELLINVIPVSGPFDYVAATVRIGKTRFTICSFYWDFVTEASESDLEGFFQSLPSPFLVCGDFDAHNTLWGSSSTNARGTLIEGVLGQFNATILNDGSSTRLDSRSGATSSPDLSICSASLFLDLEWMVTDDLHGSDHYPIVVSLVGRRWGVNTPNEASSVSERFDFSRADWNTYEELMQDDDRISEITSYEIARDVIVAMSKHAIPMVSRRTRDESGAPWWCPNLRTWRNFSRSAARRFRRNPSIANGIRYRRIRARYRRAIIEAMERHWKDFVESLDFRSRNKETWNKIRRMRGERVPKSKIGLRIGDDVTHDEQLVAGAFVERFAEASSLPPPDIELLPCIEHDERCDEPFSLREMLVALADVNVESSPGSDNISFVQIQHAGDKMQTKILEIFNVIWSSGIVPEDWRLSLIVPVPKYGRDPLSVDGYRPIALTSCLCRLFERMVLGRLVWVSDGKLAGNQFGFRLGLSAEDVIAHIGAAAAQSKLLKEHTLCLSLDLKGAYDYTPNTLYLNWLTKHGIGGNLWRYLYAASQNRRTRVIVGNGMSEEIVLERGLQQGSILSPSLFCFAIDDLFSACETPGTEIIAYADDVTILSSDKVAIEAMRSLQKCVNKVQPWIWESGLALSVDKTSLVHFRDQRSPGDTYVTFRTSREHTLRRDVVPVPSAKILGVVFDAGLTWQPHLEYVKHRISKRLDVMKFLAGTSYGASQDVLRTFYVSTMLPILEYGSVAFSSGTQTFLDGLETLQNGAMRVILGAVRSTRVTAMQRELVLMPLSLRRKSKIQTKLTRDVAMKGRFLPGKARPLDMKKEATRLLHPQRPWTLQGHEMKLDKRYEHLRIPVAKWGVYPSNPWRRQKPSVDLQLSYWKKEDTPPAVFQREFARIIEEDYSATTLVFTDGSKSSMQSPMKVGFACLLGNDASCFGVGCLPAEASIATAELRAILEALRMIKGRTDTSFVICSDSRSVLEMIGSVLYAHDILLEEVLGLLHELSGSKSISFLWIPSHSGIPGNEEVDKLAVSANQPVRTEDSLVSRFDLKAVVRQVIREETCLSWVECNWEGNGTPKLQRQGHFSDMPRRRQCLLSRLRMRHTRLTHGYTLDTAGSWVPPNPLCLCGEPISVLHIFEHCELYRTQRADTGVSISHLTGNRAEIEIVLSFLSACGLFERI